MKLKKRLKSEKRNSQSKILAAVSLALVSALTFMTVGFAAYDQILTISGAVKVSAPGSIHISNVTYLNGTDVYSASQGTGSQPQPSHDDETMIMTLHLLMFLPAVPLRNIVSPLRMIATKIASLTFRLLIQISSTRQARLFPPRFCPNFLVSQMET